MTQMIAMRAKPANSPRRNFDGRTLAADFLLVAVLIALDVVARLAPHLPEFTPVAATALFAASVLRVRALSLVVPVAAMAIGNAVLGSYDWPVMASVYGALALPALAACLSPALRRPFMAAPVLLSSALAFFAISNFAVWAFTPMYAFDASGLIKCYVAALPFLKYEIAGNLFWGAMLFGGYWMVFNFRQPTTAPGVARR
jgi:hypothetical protein